MAGPTAKPGKLLMLPFAVCVDVNEGAPWQFLGLRDPKTAQPIVTKVVTKAMYRMGLQAVQDSDGVTHEIGLADYSIDGHEPHIQVERKSVADLIATMSGRFRRFEAEICRLHQTCDYSAVIIEGSIGEVLRWNGPGRSPASVLGAVKSWKFRYPACHWYFMPTRAAAEEKCLEVLRRWWGDFEAGKLLRQRLRQR